MALFNKKTIEYSRQVLLPRSTRTQVGLVLYPQNAESTTLSVNVTTTTVVITYTSSSIQSTTIQYSNRSIEDLCLDINRAGYPLRAVGTMSNTLLRSGDLISTGTSKTLPYGFSIYDRVSDRGVCLRTKKISIRQKSSSQVRILQPYLESSILPWYPRVQVGSFSQKINNRVFHFSIPEYNSQTWSSKYGRPFRDVLSEIPLKFSDTAVRLRRTPIFWNGENIKLYNGDVPISSSSIEDVDVHAGIIYFKDNVSAKDLQVEYSYKEESYEYKDLNINCHFGQNPLTIGKFVLLYLLPFKGDGIYNRKKTVYHVIADSIEEAIDSILIEDETIPIAIIGAYNVQQVYASDRAKILDTRVLGGGLIENTGPTSPVHYHEDLNSDKDLPPKIEDSYIESNSYWDIGKWDGEIYPGAAAVVINLPEDLSDVMPLEDIKKKASKFLAAGVYPLFEFSERELPDVTGWSRQISCFGTGSITQSGIGILPVSYTLPGGLLDESWSTVYNRSLPIVESDNGYIISPTSDTGMCVPYLKSSPIAGIEWEERTHTTNLDSPNGESTYGVWNKVRSFDDREVLNHQLIKGSLLFLNNDLSKQYRNIRISSPFQYTIASKLKESIAEVLEEIYTTASLKSSVANGPIRYDVTDVNTREVTHTPNYIGLSPVYKFVLEMSDSDLYLTYLSRAYNVFLGYLNSLIVPGLVGKYNPQSATYEEPSVGTSNIKLYEVIQDLSRLTHLIRSYLGTNNAGFSLCSSVLSSLLDVLDSTSIREVVDGSGDLEIFYYYYYWKNRFTYLGSNQYSGQLPYLADLNGLGLCDVNPSYEDHNLLKNNLALCSSVLAVSLTGSNISGSLETYKDGHNLIGRVFSNLGLTSTGLSGSTVQVYPSPNTDEWRSTRYTAEVNGTEAYVYGYERSTHFDTAVTSSGDLLEASWITIGTDTTINLDIGKQDPSTLESINITGVSIYPTGTNTTYAISSGVLSLSIPENLRLRLEINADRVNALHVFTNPPEPEILDSYTEYASSRIANVEEDQTLYFSPGVHNIGKLFKLENGVRVIIPGGAVVVGSFDLRDVQGAVVEGNGVLAGTFTTPEYAQEVPETYDDVLKYSMFYGKTNTPSTDYFDNEVYGITVVATPFFLNAAGVTLWQNVQMISPWYWQTDGFSVNPRSAEEPEGLVKNCYTFCGDDSTKFIAGFRTTVIGSFFTATSASCILLCYHGEADSSAAFTRILDCDFLHLGENAPLLSVIRCWVDGSSGEDVHRRNISIDDARMWGPLQVRPFGFENRVYPFDPEGDESSEPSDGKGNIYNIGVDNVWVQQTPVTKSLISGSDPTNTPHDISFQNLQIGGVNVTQSNYTGFFTVNAHPYNLSWAQVSGSVSIDFNNLDLRIGPSINGVMENSGDPIVNSWYSRHDRLGEYAGTLTRDLIDSYEYLRAAHEEAGFVRLLHYTGLDLVSLNDYFNAITSVLKYSKVKLVPILNNGGHIPKECINLIYGYGWYVENIERHYDVYYGDRESNYVAEYSGIYNQGIDTIVKSMVTTDGKIIETDYIDYEVGPFSGQVPSLIFNALRPGLSLDYDTYLCKAAAVFNTVTGNYYVSGLFYNDPHKSSKAAGAEVPISYELARLYKSL